MIVVTAAEKVVTGLPIVPVNELQIRVIFVTIVEKAVTGLPIVPLERTTRRPRVQESSEQNDNIIPCHPSNDCSFKLLFSLLVGYSDSLVSNPFSNQLIVDSHKCRYTYVALELKMHNNLVNSSRSQHLFRIGKRS
jgi:hypothetical protein